MVWIGKRVACITSSKNGKMERSFVALAIPLLDRLALGIRDSLLLLVLG
jgi:hypothetical protein